MFTVSCFILLTLLFIGCAAKYEGYGPHFSAVEPQTRKIAILSPDVSTYEISGGGIPEYRIDWSRIGRRNLSCALRTELAKRGFEGIPVDNDTASGSNDTITAFVKHIAGTIQQHLYGQNPFLGQIDSFTYATGPLTELCERYEADALMFLFGADENFSDLRKQTLTQAATAKTVKSAVFATLSLVLTGSGVYRTYQAPNELTYLCCLVADVQGKIIWFKKYFEADGADLRKQSDVDKLAQSIVNGLNIRK